MSRFFWGLSLLGIGCTLALASRAEAASKPAGSEAWTLGFQYGGGNVSLAGDSLGRDVGRLSQLSVGRIVRPGVIAGFQARSWGKTGTDSLRAWTPSGTDTLLLGTASADLSRSVLILAMTATVFPKEKGGYLRAGVGICRVRQEFFYHFPLYFPAGHDPPTGVGIPSEEQTHEDVGFAVTAAGGWEYRARRRLGLALDVEYARFTAAHVGGNLFSYAAGLNYYW